jgi:Na+-transporting methylmalonyl-CoA/oxaloacetate decarboxylase gamma subunit
MPESIDWLTSTPLGLAVVIAALLALFGLMAFLSERKTRRLYPDRNRRGTKAKRKAAKAKAKAKAKAEQEKTD